MIQERCSCRSSSLVDGKLLAQNSRFFAPAEGSRARQAADHRGGAAADGGFRIRLAADALARNVRLSFDPAEGFFDDNYFDLVPGQPLEVSFRSKAPLTLEGFRKGLEIASLVDAF